MAYLPSETPFRFHITFLMGGNAGIGLRRHQTQWPRTCGIAALKRAARSPNLLSWFWRWLGRMEWCKGRSSNAKPVLAPFGPQHFGPTPAGPSRCLPMRHAFQILFALNIILFIGGLPPPAWCRLGVLSSGGHRTPVPATCTYAWRSTRHTLHIACTCVGSGSWGSMRLRSSQRSVP